LTRDDQRRGIALNSKRYASFGVTPELVARIRAVQAIPVPFSGYVNFHGDVMRFYGDERTSRMFAYRSFLDAGLRPPTSSDYTASPPSPMLWLYSMTMRRDPTGHVWGPAQRITPTEALRSATLSGAGPVHRRRRALAGDQGRADDARRQVGVRILIRP
jgi:predicted amidohydrolase YtcJ